MGLNNIEIRQTDMSDEDIKRALRNHPSNGAYATEVCQKCGKFRSSLNGNADTVKFHKFCKNCCGAPM